jgi:hypothetical protein
MVGLRVHAVLAEAQVTVCYRQEPLQLRGVEPDQVSYWNDGISATGPWLAAAGTIDQAMHDAAKDFQPHSSSPTWTRSGPCRSSGCREPVAPRI